MKRSQYPKQAPKAVYFYGTCLIDSLYPDAGLAAVRLIESCGVKVIFPQAQTCCGQPAMNSGYVDEARSVINSQLDLFPEDYPIVVPSGSCAGMMRDDYPEICKDHHNREKSEQIAKRIYEFTEFLVHVLRINLADTGQPVKVAVHVSCSSRRVMGVAEESLYLLGQLQNITLLPFEHETECCGFGGTFAVKHDEISAAMVADKVDAICAVSPDYVVSTDCGCQVNIEGHIRHRGLGIPCMHIAQFLWQRTRHDAKL